MMKVNCYIPDVITIDIVPKQPSARIGTKTIVDIYEMIAALDAYTIICYRKE